MLSFYQDKGFEARFSRPKWILICALVGVLSLTSCQTIQLGGAESGALIYEDRFVSGQTGNWLLESDTIGQSYIVRETLLLEVDQPQTVQYVARQGDILTDFRVGFDVTQTGGAASSSYGVLLRRQPGQLNFYRVSITGTGRYLIEKHSGGVVNRLTDGWVKTDALTIGLNQTQRVEVLFQGSTMQLFINEQPVVSVEDAEFTSGELAFTAGTFNSGELQVAFDNLVVTQP